MRRALGWFAGLGVAAQLLLGVSVAAAAGATGVGAVVGITKLIEVVAPQPARDPRPVEQEETGSGPSETPAQPAESFGPSQTPATANPTPEVTEQPLDDETEAPHDDAGDADDSPGNGNQGNGNQGNDKDKDKN